MPNLQWLGSIPAKPTAASGIAEAIQGGMQGYQQGRAQRVAGEQQKFENKLNLDKLDLAKKSDLMNNLKDVVSQLTPDKANALIDQFAKELEGTYGTAGVQTLRANAGSSLLKQSQQEIQRLRETSAEKGYKWQNPDPNLSPSEQMGQARGQYEGEARRYAGVTPSALNKVMGEIAAGQSTDMFGLTTGIDSKEAADRKATEQLGPNWKSNFPELQTLIENKKWTPEVEIPPSNQLIEVTNPSGRRVRIEKSKLGQALKQGYRR